MSIYDTPYNNISELPYTQEQIDSVPGIRFWTNVGLRNGDSQYLVNLRIDRALADPVAFVKDDLKNSAVQASYYGPENLNAQLKFLQDKLPPQELQAVVNDAGNYAQKWFEGVRQEAIAFEKAGGGGGGGFELFGPNSIVGNLAPIAAAIALPGVGEALAPALVSAGVPAAIAPAVGAGLASAAVQVAQGVPIETAIQNAAISSVVQTGATDVGQEMVKAGSNAAVANAVSSVGGSIVSTAAKGGSMDDISKNAVGALVGSGVISASDGDRALGLAAGTLAAGGNIQQAATAYGAQIGREIGQDYADTPTPATTPAAPPIATQEPSVTPETPPSELATTAPEPALPPVTSTAPETVVPPTAGTLPETTVTATQPTDSQIIDLITQAQPKTDVTTPPISTAPVVPAPTAPAVPTETPSLPETTVTAERPTDAQLIDLITQAQPTTTPSVAETAPSVTTPPVAEVPSLPETTVTAEAPKDSEIIDLITSRAGDTGGGPASGALGTGGTLATGTLPETTVTGTREEPVITDVVPTAPVTTTPETSTQGTLPEVTVTAEKEQPVVSDVVAPPTQTTGTLPEVTVPGTREQPVTSDVVAPPTDTRGTLPETTVTATREEPVVTDTVGTLPEVRVTPDREEPTITDTTAVDTTVKGPEEPPAEITEPTEPTVSPLQPLLISSVKPKTKTVSTTLYPTISGIYRSPLEQALTSFTPAGEITGSPTGKKRENVWNEASLRLKDALGL